MKFEDHVEHCKQTLGEGFPEVHKFLDQWHDQLGAEHRAVHHNPGGVMDVIIRFGYKAGAAACLHIWADKEGLIRMNDGTFGIAPTVQT